MPQVCLGPEFRLIVPVMVSWPFSPSVPTAGNRHLCRMGNDLFGVSNKRDIYFLILEAGLFIIGSGPVRDIVKGKGT